MHSTSVLQTSHTNRLPSWFAIVLSYCFCCIGCPQQPSAPSPAFVTIISAPQLVHWYRLPTWFPNSYLFSLELGDLRRSGESSGKCNRALPTRQLTSHSAGVSVGLAPAGVGLGVGVAAVSGGPDGSPATMRPPIVVGWKSQRNV